MHSTTLFRRRVSFLWLACVSVLPLFAVSIADSSRAIAQSGIGNFGTLGGREPVGQYPSQQYYIALEIYRSGDIDAAIDAFDSALRSARRDINGRMIDSIPVLAMLSECHWQMGDLQSSRDFCDQAFQIAIRYRGWLRRIDWSTALQQNVQRSPQQGLWPEATAVAVVPVANKLQYRSGQPLTAQAVARGGVLEEQNIRTMDLVEIMRGLAIASYRRRIILGSLADQDPLASGLLESTKYPAGLNVPIAQTLIGAMRTAEYFSNHDDERTVSTANQKATFGGGAHPLTSIATLSQASALASGDAPESIVPLAMKLVHASAALEQPEFIGEAMQLAAGCANEQQALMLRQAANTVATSMHRKSRLATLHCLVAGADAAITGRDLDAAATMLGQAQALSGRRDVIVPRLEAYGAYVTARLAAARGSSIGVTKPTDVDEALSRMTAFALNNRSRKRQLVSMPRIYQLNLIRQAIGTTLGGNTSDALLKEYCGDPSADVWRRDAVDALSGVLVDRSLAHLARVNLAASAGYGDKLLQAVDLMLTARFNQSLPLGGRISQVRALARLDDQKLDKELADFRKQAGRGMQEIRGAVAGMAEPNAIQVENLESKACSVALDRLHVPQVNPPVLDEKLPVAQLPGRTGLLTFTVVGNKVYGTLSQNGKVNMWAVGGSNRLPREIGNLLRGIGVGKARGNRLPEDESWKTTAVALRRHLLPDDTTISADRFDELIIVPDGPLWYLPFELMPMGDENSPLMADQMSVRYAATPGLALKPVSDPPLSRAVGLSTDLFFAPRDNEINTSMVQSIVDVLADPVRLPEVVDTPSGLLGNKLGHLVVAAPRLPSTKNPPLMSVAPYDQSSPYGTLAAWMRFPAEVPRTVVLFGYRTAVDLGQMGNGEEVFHTLCSLNAAGVRSILLSRWAVGGESSAIALRELLQELPFAGMNRSWARARMMLRRSELDPSGEPLLPKAEHDREGVSGDQPLFWAGYLVSAPPHPSEAEEDEPEEQPAE